MDLQTRLKKNPADLSSETGGAVCSKCGYRIRSRIERLRGDDGSFICDQCYKHISFPEQKPRCSE